MSNFESKYGGFVLLYVFGAMLLALAAIPFAAGNSPWWVIPVLTAPIILFTIALTVGTGVALFLAALEDYRGASNTDTKAAE